LAKLRRESSPTITSGNHTLLTGIRCFGSTFAKYAGRAPSLAHAHVKREELATDPMQTEMIVQRNPPTIAEAPGMEFVADRQMAMSGYPDARRSSTLPRVVRKMMIMPKGRAPLRQMDQNMARGMEEEARRVSSEMWAEASKPGEAL